MKKSYHLSKSLIPSHFVSKHWDIYPKGFENILFDKEKLSRFRNNELSFKCNDSLEERTQSKELRVLKGLSNLVNKELTEKENPVNWGKVGRNAPCPCGSGSKFKHCHGKN